MEKLQQIYQERYERFQAEAVNLKSKYNRFSIVRLLVFIAGMGLIVLLWSVLGPLVGLVSVVIFLLAFARFIVWHQAIQQAQRHHERLAVINTNEVSFLNDDYSVFGDGEEFTDAQHPYTVDMDIFGPYSFFQYCNRTSTAIGKACLLYTSPSPRDS